MYVIKNKTNHGGKRKGAGRKSLYGKPTKAIRVPIDMVESIQTLMTGVSYKLPLFSSKVAAGIPSPAHDHMDTKLDLNPPADRLLKRMKEALTKLCKPRT